MCEVPKTLLATLLRSLALHAALPSVGFHGCSLEEKELAMEDPSSERAKSAHRVHFEQLQAAESAT